MTSMHGGNIAIVGAAETDNIGVIAGQSAMELHAEAARRALADAGLGIGDVDGIATAGPSPIEVAHYLGIKPRWLDGTMVGGCSFMLHVRHAAAAIASGAANTVLVTHGESGRSRVGMLRSHKLPQDSAPGQFEFPYGALPAYAAFTLPALSFLENRGMDRSALAQVVVAQRKWAMENPRAFRQKPITVEQALDDAGLVAYPFTKDMCCVVTDGGGALVLTSAERAADLDLSSRVVWLLGSGEACDSPTVGQMEDHDSSQAFRRSGAEAFATAGLGPADIDHLMGYDAFAHLPLYMLEVLGFVARGESADFIASGATGRGGSLPMNTNGGGLSYTHTGMYGMFAIQEAVRQLRGEAAAQVEGVRTSFVQGVGFFFAAAGSLILSSDRP